MVEKGSCGFAAMGTFFVILTEDFDKSVMFVRVNRRSKKTQPTEASGCVDLIFCDKAEDRQRNGFAKPSHDTPNNGI